MFFQTVMFFWAVIALLIGVGCTVALLNHKVPAEGTETPPKSLFDFSAGQIEGKQMQHVLKTALSESETDTEFEHRFKNSVQVASGINAELTWAWLGRTLLEYRQANEFEPSSRTLADRFLADIPHRYKLQSQPAESTQV